MCVCIKVTVDKWGLDEWMRLGVGEISVYERLINSEQWWKGVTTDLYKYGGFYTWSEFRIGGEKKSRQPTSWFLKIYSY